MTKTKADKRSVARKVRQYLANCHPGGVVLEVLNQGGRREEYWWYVPVRPDKEPGKLFEYYEALADVEEALAVKEHLTVLLMPGIGCAGAVAMPQTEAKAACQISTQLLQPAFP